MARGVSGTGPREFVADRRGWRDIERPVMPVARALRCVDDPCRDGANRLFEPECLAIAQAQPEIDGLRDEQRDGDQYRHLTGQVARPHSHNRVTSAASV